MDQIKSAPFSSPHQSSDSRKHDSSASRRDAVVATNICNTPRPEISFGEKPTSARPLRSGKEEPYGEVEPLAQGRDGNDERDDGEDLAMAGMGEAGANRVENRFPLVSRRQSDEPAVSTPAPLRCNLQQSKLLAAAAAIETAAAAVAAVAAISMVR